MASLRTVVVAGIQYLIHPLKLGTIQATINPDSILPVTLMTTDEIFGGNLEENLARFDAFDDVYIPDFSFVLIEQTSGNDTGATSAQRAGLEQDVFQLHLSRAFDDMDDLPSGPYFLYGPNIYQAWRLYDDEYDAFTVGVIPEYPFQPDLYRPLSALSPNGAYKSVGVPSRLYLPEPSEEKPLSGARFSVSDAFSIVGVPTTLSSRAWSLLYPFAAFNTAQYVKKLTELGAVVVGKTKISQFASGKEWVDETAPWNPRADGYQGPSGSSAGAGAAMAGYEWLAYALGEDAIGGLSEPAAAAGVYSLRPSYSNSSFDGVQTNSPRFDAVGISARGLKGLLETAQILFDLDAPTELPTELIYLNDFDADLSDDQLNLTDRFVEALESSLGVKTLRTSLAGMWAKNTPEAANKLKLDEYLKEAPFRSFCYDIAQQYGEFQDDYRDRFESEPFLEDTTKFRWDYGANVTEDQYAADVERLDVFRKWFQDTVFSAENGTVVVLPSGHAQPAYRQDRPGPPRKIEGITVDFLASVLGTPQLTVPFTQTPFKSKVTGKTEQLPVSASVLGAVGSDVQLIELVKSALELVPLPTSIETGQLAFP